MHKKDSTVTLIAFTALNPEVSSLDIDFMPVLAARVSHGQDGKTGGNEAADLKLMKYLAENKHFSPFEHVSVTFLIECPLFVRSEWHRHRTQAYNEISMRYSESNIGEVWVPDVFRKQDTRNKQSSAGAIEKQEEARSILLQSYSQSVKDYYRLLELGVAREQARGVIPSGHMTRFYASANMRNWAHFCMLRCADDAQFEIRELANEVDNQLGELYPNTWRCLRETRS